MRIWRNLLRITLALICLLLITPLIHPAEQQILASVYPVYIFTKNVISGVPDITLDLLISPQGGHIHDYALTPADLKKIAAADLFIINGAGLEVFLPKVRQEITPDHKIVDTSTGVKLLAGKDVHISANPHIFTSPYNAIIQVRNIAAALKKADQKHAALFEKNAISYIGKLTKLNNEIKKAVAGFPNKKIITFHNAFAYFARDMGLDVVGVIESTPGQQPTAGELSALVRLIRQLKIKAVFTEPQYSDKLALVIAREARTQLYSLDPAATGGLEADVYIKVMVQNLKTLQIALGDEN